MSERVDEAVEVEVGSSRGAKLDVVVDAVVVVVDADADADAPSSTEAGDAAALGSSEGDALGDEGGLTPGGENGSEVDVLLLPLLLEESSARAVAPSAPGRLEDRANARRARKSPSIRSS